MKLAEFHLLGPFRFLEETTCVTRAHEPYFHCCPSYFISLTLEKIKQLYRNNSKVEDTRIGTKRVKKELAIFQEEFCFETWKKEINLITLLFGSFSNIFFSFGHFNVEFYASFDCQIFPILLNSHIRSQSGLFQKVVHMTMLIPPTLTNFVFRQEFFVCGRVYCDQLRFNRWTGLVDSVPPDLKNHYVSHLKIAT